VNYQILGVVVALFLIAAATTNGVNQPLKATPSSLPHPIITFCDRHPQVCVPVFVDFCEKHPEACVLFEEVIRKIEPEPCKMCPWENINWKDLITIPENQSLSLSVKHGPTSDTIMIEVPKALSSALMNSSVVSPQPQPNNSTG
jgi:hypothetical protein